jgi:hypothetical protein
MAVIWHLACQKASRGVINAATQTPNGLATMTALLVSALIAAVAANVALVPFVADCLSSKDSASVPGAGLRVSNENLRAASKIAA